MSPRKHTVDAAKGVLEIEWPFFGELSRGLALKVARAYDPEIVIGIATAGVIPGAVIAAILGREFHSLVVSRKYRTSRAREAPEVFGSAPKEVRGKRVLIVDETCDSGDTMRLAVSAVQEGGAAEVRTAVSIPHRRLRSGFSRDRDREHDHSPLGPGDTRRWRASSRILFTPTRSAASRLRTAD